MLNILNITKMNMGGGKQDPSATIPSIMDSWL